MRSYCAASCGFCYKPPSTEIPDTTPRPTIVTDRPLVTFYPTRYNKRHFHLQVSEEINRCLRGKFWREREEVGLTADISDSCQSISAALAAVID